MNLIKESECRELYIVQIEILERLNKKLNADDIIRLALLQTLQPIEDYESAMKILDYYSNEIYDVRIGIIGAYISSTFDYKDIYSFLESLIQNIHCYTREIQAIVYYIKALYIRNRTNNKEEVREYLLKSIELYDGYVNNYLELSKYLPQIEKRECMIKAKCNIREVEDSMKIRNYSVYHLIEPLFFICSHIEGVIIDSYNYDEYFKMY